MSTKDFKQGMVAGAKPFGDKLEQLAGASERGVRDIQEGIGGVKDVVDAILDDLSVQEKKKIYDLDTPTGIAELEPEEKEYLLAVLFTIAEAQNEVTEYQRFYLRALKSYLGVVGIQSGIDLSTIENIESITTQKILLQTVMEFLYLAYQSHDYMNDYADLFDYFSVNRRGVTELQQAIDHMAALLGMEGIACHYSPLAEPVEVDEEEALEDEQEACAQRSGCSKIVIDGKNIPVFKMRVEDVFSIIGKGPVVTGTIEEGSISLDDEVVVFRGLGASPKTVTVLGIEMHNGLCNHAEKGDNVGLLLGGVSKETLSRGNILAKDEPITFEQEMGNNAPAVTVRIRYNEFGYYQLSSSTGVLQNITVQNFAGLEVENTQLTDCAFEMCGDLTIDGCTVVTSNFCRVEFLSVENTKITDSHFCEASCSRDCAISLVDGTILHSTFENVELRNGAYLCDAVGNVAVNCCTFRNCRTEREDLELFHCEGAQGKLFKKSVAIDIVDRATCIGLDAVQHIQKIAIKKAHNYRCEIYVRTYAEGGRHTPFFSNYRPLFRFDKSEVIGVITLPDGVEMCMPGDTAQATVSFESAMALANGERLVYFLKIERPQVAQDDFFCYIF